MATRDNAENPTKNTPHEVAESLKDLLEACEIPEDFCPVELKRVETFAEAGLLTRDAGLVLRFEDGSEFQVTVVQSSRGRGPHSED